MHELAVDIDFQLDQARDAVRMLGSEVKKLMDSLDVKKVDDDRLRFRLEVSNATLEAAFTKLEPFMGMAKQTGPAEAEPFIYKQF